MDSYHVGYLVGSLAAHSINRKLARALTLLAPPELRLSEIRYADRRTTATITIPRIRQDEVVRRAKRLGTQDHARVKERLKRLLHDYGEG